MRKNSDQGSRLARAMAVAGAMALWGIAGGLVLWEHGGGWISTSAKATETAVSLPAPKRIVFRFPTGADAPPLGFGIYGLSPMEQSNSLALDQVMTLLKRIPELPVALIWVGSDQPATKRRSRWLETEIASRAIKHNIPFSAGPWPVRVAAPLKSNAGASCWSCA